MDKQAPDTDKGHTIQYETKRDFSTSPHTFKIVIFHNVYCFTCFFWSNKCTFGENKRLLSKTFTNLTDPKLLNSVFSAFFTWPWRKRSIRNVLLLIYYFCFQHVQLFCMCINVNIAAFCRYKVLLFVKATTALHRFIPTFSSKVWSLLQDRGPRYTFSAGTLLAELRLTFNVC